MHKTDRGTSLLELVVVMAIVVILALVAALKLGSYDTMRIDSAARKVASTIRYAQKLAMLNPGTAAQPNSYVVDFDLPSQQYFIMRSIAGAAYEPVLDPYTKEPFNVSFSSGTYKGLCLYASAGSCSRASATTAGIGFKDSLGTPYYALLPSPYDLSSEQRINFTVSVILEKGSPTPNNSKCLCSEITVYPQTGLVTVSNVWTQTTTFTSCIYFGPNYPQCHVCPW
ncbi:MAG: type II secretion system protein [Candidatus Omnitrophota bacterium]